MDSQSKQQELNMLETININNTAIEIVPFKDLTLYETRKTELGIYQPASPASPPDKLFAGIENVRYYNDELYNQIWLIERKYNVGFITQDFDTTVEVWNAYRTPKTLNSVGWTVGEVELGSPVSLPYTFPANTSKLFNLKVLGEGASNINASINFNFMGESAVIGNITGQRAIIFNYPHNWIQEYSESYQFYTVILPTLTLEEQRASYGERPLFKCTYHYSLSSTQKQEIDNLLYSIVNDVVTLPLHVYSVRLLEDVNIGDTQIVVNRIEHTIIQNNLSLLIEDGERREIVDILSYVKATKTLTLKKPITKQFSKGVKLTPVINARIDEISKDNVVTNFSNYTITFEKTMDDKLDLLTTNSDFEFTKLNGKNYVDFKPNDNLDINYNYINSRVSLTNEYGKKEYYQYSDVNAIAYEFDQVIVDPTWRTKYKTMWREQAGMYEDLYIDNYSQDLTVTKDIEAIETQILVKNVNASNFIKDKKIKYVSLNCFNKKYIIEIKDIIRYDTDNEAIVMSSNIGERIPLNSINSLSFIYFGRLNSDEFVLNYTTGDNGQALLKTSFPFYKTIDEEED